MDCIPPRAAYLSSLGLVLAVLGEQVTEYISTAAGDVDQRALLPQAEPRGDGQHQGDGLDDQGPLPQVAPDDEPAEYGFDLKETEMRASGFVCVRVERMRTCLSRGWIRLDTPVRVHNRDKAFVNTEGRNEVCVLIFFFQISV